MSARPAQIIRLQKWFKQPLHILFIFILVGGIFFRFYGTPQRFGFDKDPTRDALVTVYGARHLALPLIGPASGIAAFTFGPWYYYELIFFSLLVPTYYAPFYFIPLFSVLLIILMYFIGIELEGEYLGLILATFAAFSPSFVGPATGLSNPNLVAPHVAGSILIFLLFLKKKRSWQLSLLWGIVMGIGINNHYEMIPILLLPLIYFAMHIKHEWKAILAFSVGLCITFLPLLYFNLSNHWYTLSGVIQFASSGGSNNYIPNNWHLYLFKFWPQFFDYIFATPPLVSSIIVGIVGIYYGYLLIRRKFNLPSLLLCGVFLFIFILLRYYNAERAYYYFIFLEPLLFIVVGLAISKIRDNKVGTMIIVVIMLLFVLSSLPADLERIRANSDNRIAHGTVETLTEKFPSQQFTIYACQQKALETPMGVAFLLDGRRKLTDAGQKIGFNNDLDRCPLPDPSANKISNNIYNFYALPDTVLNKYGWYKISPETVYKNTVLWWTSEYRKI